MQCFLFQPWSNLRNSPSVEGKRTKYVLYNDSFLYCCPAGKGKGSTATCGCEAAQRLALMADSKNHEDWQEGPKNLHVEEDVKPDPAWDASQEWVNFEPLLPH